MPLVSDVDADPADRSAGGGSPERADPGRRRGTWWRSRRGWVAGGALGVAAVLGVVLALRVGAAPACAAVPIPAVPIPAVLIPAMLNPAVPIPVVPNPAIPVMLAAPLAGSTVHQGRSTFYDSRGGGGNCSFVQAPADRRYVALGPAEYAAGAACGGYLDVTGPRGKVRVLIMDQCPECEPGHLDLSREAFAAIADPVQGIVPVTYQEVVNPTLPGPLTFRMKEGTSRWWFAVLVGDHGNPLVSVEAKATGSAWRGAVRQSYNYWVVDGGLGPGPYSIRVTDGYGHQVVATGIRLTPGETQRSTVRMYGASGALPTPPARTATPAPTSPGPTTSAATSSATSSAAPTPAGSATAVVDPSSRPVPDCRAAPVYHGGRGGPGTS